VPIRWPAPLPEVLLYHKPAGELVSRHDPQGRACVFTQLPRGNWVAIGRLDFNSSGLLLFTSCGELAQRMMHPRFGLAREYAVRVLAELTAEQLALLRTGVPLDDGLARCETVQAIGGSGRNRWYRLVLREGRNREIRRLFAYFGISVSRLIRVRFGSVVLPPRLRQGQYCRLKPEEVAQLCGELKLLPEAPASADLSATTKSSRPLTPKHKRRAPFKCA